MVAEQTVRVAESAIREKEKQIRFKVKPFRVEDLVKKFERKQFYIPDYQREDVWNYSMKSKFIESVLLGLPIPDIFVCEAKTNSEDYDQLTQYEIIDGSQRLRTLAGFVKRQFHLTGLETIQELENFNYTDLTNYRKDRFKDVTIDVIILNADTTEDVKNAMFDRINTSNPLKVMELRRGAHGGLFNDFIRNCGKILQEEYSDICPINKYFRDRREEEELALRFFAFSETINNNLVFTNTTGERISKHNKGTDEFLTAFYTYQNDRLKQIKNKNQVAYNKEITRLEDAFKQMLEFVKINFPYGFKRDHSKSVARVVFEAISVGVHLALKEQPNLFTKRVDTTWVKKDSKFKDCINQRYGLHEANKIIERINLVKENLLEEHAPKR